MRIATVPAIAALIAAIAAAAPAAIRPGPVYAGAPAATSSPASPGSREIQTLVLAGTLADLRWPNFGDYQSEVNSFYAAGGYVPAWIAGDRPTAQALALIDAFRNADSKGLVPDDYDASRWDARIALLAKAGTASTSIDAAQFDVALTVCAMRYLADVSVGRVNPRHVKFGVEMGGRKAGLAEFLRGQIIGAGDTAAVIASVEPHYAGYQRALTALAAYRRLAAQGDGEPLPAMPKAVRPGGVYPGVPQLVARLRQLGDLAPDAAIPADPTRYTEPLVAAVRQFQQRHGYERDGILGRTTIAALNVPLRRRVQQLALALERYRWIPPAFAQPPIIINIPEFILRTMRRQPAPFLQMRVVVGKAYRRQTPVFIGNLRYVIFRPYWYVPLSIQRAEMVPKIRRDRDYLMDNDFEVVDGTHLISSGPVSDEILADLRAGRLEIRQRPGPENALGLVKFIFPNSYNVYMHDTPAVGLFAHARRDFSHGCIRVEDAPALAAWVLRDDPEWPPDRIAAAMNGDETIEVHLARPVPVVILYSTAVVEPDGEVRFFDDIYGHDAALSDQLAHDYPYPDNRAGSEGISNPAPGVREDPY